MGHQKCSPTRLCISSFWYEGVVGVPEYTGALVEWEATVSHRVNAWVERGRLSRPKNMRKLVQMQ